MEVIWRKTQEQTRTGSGEWTDLNKVIKQKQSIKISTALKSEKGILKSNSRA